MANAWNELTWGIGNYGEQNNATVSVSGVSASTSIGTDFTITTTVDFGWSRKEWGTFAWGIQGTLLATGSSATATTGTLTTQADALVEPTTVSATFSIDQVITRIDNEVIPDGVTLQTFTGNEGTEGNAIVIPTGASATTNTGQATIDPTYLVGEGWGRDTWGNWAWGVNYSVIAAGPNGLSASIVTGNEDAFTDITVAISGQQLQTAITPVGTSANADHEIAASLLISSAQGDTTIEGTALVELTGISASVNIGDAEAGLLLEVPVTGVSANINIGNEDTSGNANVFPSGVSATFTLGNVTAVSVYSVTGVSASFNIGQVTTVGSATVIPTGISLTTAIGSPRITAWAEVNTGTQVTWTEVDLAA